MKILFFIFKRYSLKKTLTSGFNQLGHEVKIYDYRDFFNPIQNKVYDKLGRFPNKVKDFYIHPYYDKINKKYKEIVDNEKPDLLFIYNDQFIYPETVRYIRNKYCPVMNYLGDSPFYLPDRPFNIASLLEMSFVFSPDTFWIKQLKQIGVKNISHLLFGYDESLNYPIEPSEEEKKRWGHDLVMIGYNYFDSMGYKRALFFNQFSDLDLIIYGDGWARWFNYFPGLKDKCINISEPLTFEKVNLIYNCSKILPVEHNAGILNGIHTRVFEAIGSGILPLVEFRNDIDEVFKDQEIPVIKRYGEGKDIAQLFINDNEKRKKLIKDLQLFVQNNYTPLIAAEKILKIISGL
jgi:spore maturation protein CgeB